MSLPERQHHRVALRGGFGAILHCRLADEYDRANRAHLPFYDDDYRFVSYDLYTDLTFAHLLFEDMDALDVDEAFLAELFAAKEAPAPRRASSEELNQALREICLAQRSELAELGV